MKKKIIVSLATVLSTFALGQVGINTTTPKATLDIVGNTSSGSADGILIPRFSVTELSSKDAAYDASQNGVLVFVTSGTGSSGKTSDVTGSGFYYYDNSISKWKSVGGNQTGTAFNITAEQISDYTVLATDNFVKLNTTTPGHTLTLPTSGISIGKMIYVSNIGTNGISISPLPRNPQFPQVQSGVSGILVYLGGTGNGSWDWITGF